MKNIIKEKKIKITKKENKHQKEKIIEIPTNEALENELKRINYRKKYRFLLKRTIYSILIVAAISVLIASLYMPVLEITGASMTPTIYEGDYTLAIKKNTYEQKDVIAFYYNNKVLVKRIIASYGDWVTIDADGNVFVNNIILDEPYVISKSFEISNIKYPYQVPDNSYFVLGDDRMDSIDSRNETIGCVSKKDIIGKIWLRFYPLNKIKIIK